MIFKLQAFFVLNHPEIITVPNVFSADSNGKNDPFYLATKYVTSLNSVIRNRSGNPVFEKSSVNPTWNGGDNLKRVYFLMYFQPVHLAKR